LLLASCSQPPVALDHEGVAACDRLFDATYSRCGGPRWAAQELARNKALFEQACRNRALMPGSAINAEVLDTCAARIASSDCHQGLECDIRGTLDGGASCFDHAQCRSGRCSASMSQTPAWPIGPITCGTCALAGEAGDDCSDGRVCPPDFECYADKPLATHRCNPRLLPPEGPTCADASCGVGLNGDCRSDLDCATGLGCTGYGTLGMCIEIEWVEPDELCDEARRCRVGRCGGDALVSFPARCPSLIPDGQPCAGGPERTSTCDTFSQCLEGICTPLGRGDSCLHH
jgi:hypothetical protein